MTVVILGCGYTGKHVARRLLARGDRVICTSRHPDQMPELVGAETVQFEVPTEDSLAFIPLGSSVVYSIPPIDEADPQDVWRALQARRPEKVVYLSTTGVYGEQRDIDEHSVPAARHKRDEQRLEAESFALNGPWSAIVLRPAAIYGQDRGIHASMSQGRFQLVGKGDNFVSRIHVEDLAAHIEAGLSSRLTGAWPVSDEEPCTSREIARYCANLLSLPMPASVPADSVHHTRRADRRVDGSGIRRTLGLSLLYPSYKSGIPSSLK